MTTLARLCSECGKSLQGKAAKARTCSPSCRTTRSRRLRKEAATLEAETPSGQAKQHTEQLNVFREVVRGETTDVARSIMRDELRPVVREAMTEDVLQSITELLKLTGTAVAALHEDLLGDDPVIRQRAYTLLIKYTIGHPALVKAEDTDPKSQMVVNFNLPRPGPPEAALEDDADAVALVLKFCDMCDTEKPIAEFVDGSSRCRLCFEEWRAAVVKDFST